jgi:NAD+ synthase (glutamine-hydrolysing)
MRRLRVATCQINTIMGDIDGNVDKIIEMLEAAEEAGADIAVFPELAVCGYPPEDLVLKPAFVEDCRDAMERLAARTGDCAAVVGYVDGDRDLFNAAALCVNGEVVLRHHKRILPNYAVFDERRYFTPGSADYHLAEIKGIKVGLAICEDIWSPTGPMFEQAAGGAEVIMVPNGSPYRQGKHLDRDILLSSRSSDASCGLVYVNQVGGQDELVFDGGSVVFDHEGQLVARAPQFVENLMVCDLDVPRTYRKRRLDPRGQEHPSPELPVVSISGPSSTFGAPLDGGIVEPFGLEEEIWEALVLGTRDYAQKNGFTDVGVALSGGIDSTIVVAIAVDALGPEHVHAVLMPSRFSSDHSVSDAVRLCENLGVEHRTIEIEPGHQAFLDMLAPSFEGMESDTTEENLQSRIRGVLMMGLSNKLGWLILTTGNKSEMSVGYSTLYGDTAGGYSVIRDVFKLMVYRLCRWRNEKAGSEIIPVSVIDKAPSAELRPDQRDDQSLPPYEELDPILAGYVEDDLTAGELIERGHDDPTVRRIVRLVDIAEYKRRQSPPGIRVTSKAFGRDRRMPMTNRYRG